MNDDKVTLDRAVIQEILGIANNARYLLGRMQTMSYTLDNIRYIAADLERYFIYMQKQLGPAVYGDAWQGPSGKASS
jgi:hypothetical protein